jgi:molybdopterin-guanine dinucleotide biosynthesis protein
VFPVATSNYALARQGTQAKRIEQEALKAGVITAKEHHRLQTDLEQADSDVLFQTASNTEIFLHD